MRMTAALLFVGLLLPTPAGAAFTLGEQGVRNLDIFGTAKVGVEHDFEAGEGDPAVGFDFSTVSLFLGGHVAPTVSYLFHHTFDKGSYGLLDCWVQWQPCGSFLLCAGQLKAPFGRLYNTSGNKLMFKIRNPIVSYYPQYQVGVAPGFSLLDGKVELSAGVFDGEGRNAFNADPNLLYAANLVVSPFGPVPMDESGHPGFAEPVFAIVPGWYTNAARIPFTTVDVTTTSYGVAGALRYDYLAVDAGCYVRTVDDPSIGGGKSSSTGLTAQAGYAVQGKYEPILRFTMVDPNTGTGDDEVMTIEGGLNWYLDGYASRLGLNYLRETTGGSVTQSVVKLYYQFIF